MTRQQSPNEVLFWLAQQNGGEITKKQAVEAIGGRYFCNAEKHVGDVLSRMVNRRILARIKPGYFKLIGTGKNGRPMENNPNQSNLFAPRPDTTHFNPLDHEQTK